jgi:hypothetical protein
MSEKSLVHAFSAWPASLLIALAVLFATSLCVGLGLALIGKPSWSMLVTGITGTVLFGKALAHKHGGSAIRAFAMWHPATLAFLLLVSGGALFISSAVLVSGRPSGWFLFPVGLCGTVLFSKALGAKYAKETNANRKALEDLNS